MRRTSRILPTIVALLLAAPATAHAELQLAPADGAHQTALRPTLTVSGIPANATEVQVRMSDSAQLDGEGFLSGYEEIRPLQPGDTPQSFVFPASPRSLTAGTWWWQVLVTSTEPDPTDPELTQDVVRASAPRQVVLDPVITFPTLHAVVWGRDHILVSLGFSTNAATNLERVELLRGRRVVWTRTARVTQYDHLPFKAYLRQLPKLHPRERLTVRATVSSGPTRRVRTTVVYVP